MRLEAVKLSGTDGISEPTKDLAMNIEFKRLGKKLVGCIVADVVMAAVLVRGNNGWQIDDMIPMKYLNADRQQEITDAINKKLNELNTSEVVKLVRVN